MSTSIPTDVPAGSARGDGAESPAMELNRLSLWERTSFGMAHWGLSLFWAIAGFGGVYRFGCVFGLIEWSVNYKRRRRFATALARVLGHTPSASVRRRETRAYFMRSRCDKLFYLLLDRVSADRVDSVFTIKNRSLLDDAVARGKGVYVAMSHHGPQLIVGMLLCLSGYPAAAVRDGKESGIRRFVQGRFDRRHPQFRRLGVLFSESFPREIYRRFKEGLILGSAMDVSRVRHPNQKAERLTLFGEQRDFVTGPLRVAFRCDTPVVQAFAGVDDRGHYHLDIVGVLLDPREVENEDQAVRDAMQTYVAAVEKRVRESPSLLSRI